MENKLCAGMYLRTNEGIRKIIEEYEEGYELNEDLHFNYPEGHDLYKEDINEDIDEIILCEPSFNIVDLLKKGDYVNGELIEDITGEYLRVNGESHNKFYFSKQIKSIVTKEQFEQMEYRIGE